MIYLTQNRLDKAIAIIEVEMMGALNSMVSNGTIWFILAGIIIIVIAIVIAIRKRKNKI